jgi:O-succinylbenzoic acid--CoA ligase
MRPVRRIAATEGHAVVHAALREAFAGGPAVFVAADARGSAAADASAAPDVVAHPIGLVVETSGTTGRPKRVALPVDAVLASAAASESALGGPAQWVLALPVHYIAGLNVLARSLVAQTDPVAIAPGRFTASGFIDAARRLDDAVPPAMSLVPAQLATLLDDAEARAVLRGFQAILIELTARTPGEYVTALKLTLLTAVLFEVGLAAAIAF